MEWWIRKLVYTLLLHLCCTHLRHYDVGVEEGVVNVHVVGVGNGIAARNTQNKGLKVPNIPRNRGHDGDPGNSAQDKGIVEGGNIAAHRLHRDWRPGAGVSRRILQGLLLAQHEEEDQVLLRCLRGRIDFRIAVVEAWVFVGAMVGMS